jgi:hypothetical protein
MEPLSSHASIFAIGARGSGEQDQLVLNDGTQVQLPARSRLDETRTRLNALVTASGVGTRSRTGKFIEAMEIRDKSSFELIRARSTEGEEWQSHEGIITKTLLTPEGDIDGLVLSDQFGIRFRPVPSREAGELSPGVRVRAAGPSKQNQLHADALILSGKELGLSTLLAPPEKSKAVYLLPEIRSKGKIQTVLKNPFGEPETIVLSDGTVVRVPPSIQHKLTFALKPGEAISLDGFGGSYPLGSAMEAKDIRREHS